MQDIVLDQREDEIIKSFTVNTMSPLPLHFSETIIRTP